MKKLIAICALVVLFSMGYAGAGTWTTIDMPGASGTYLTGIDGRNLVGNYTDTTGTHGFLYNGTSWTTLDKPGASDTYLDGIDGRNLVGTYRIGESYHGFLYDGTTWTTLDMPGASKTYAYGMDGSNIVGHYFDLESPDWGFPFLYNTTTQSWTTIEKPGAIRTNILGIDGDNLVGSYTDDSGFHGLLYDGTNWTTLDMPGGSYTHIYGISGNTLVGRFQTGSFNMHGFLYDGTTWTTLDAPWPGTYYTLADDIDGSNIVGYYVVGADSHGFLYVIPEPATLLLLGFGAVMVRRYRK